MERKENVKKLQRRANAALSMDPEPLTEMFLKPGRGKTVRHCHGDTRIFLCAVSVACSLIQEVESVQFFAS